MSTRKYLFGPVQSRRLGVSLGIDLLPFKSCSMNCIYCECGATTRLTNERAEYVPTADVLSEIDQFMSKGEKIDYITFAGSGEPTLHIGIGKIITHLKHSYPEVKVAVLTNGSLLGVSEVQKDLMLSDIVVPSLDGGTEKSFDRICRPAEGVLFRQIVEGLHSFNNLYKGKLIVEYFVVPGINDSDEEIRAFREIMMSINVKNVQLNSLDRPGTDSLVKKPLYEDLEQIALKLSPLSVEIVPSRKKESALDVNESTDFARIIGFLKKGPANSEIISQMLLIPQGDVAKRLLALEKKGIVVRHLENKETFILSDFMQKAE